MTRYKFLKYFNGVKIETIGVDEVNQEIRLDSNDDHKAYITGVYPPDINFKQTIVAPYLEIVEMAKDE
ncbi:hypothetical protein EFN70_01305 [Pediococcus ethanolidurans]|uniref:hypothetical protein n=1 Tax=Pediococcus ethanolidurans TaxID=319653 RepID=UPI0021AA26D9|nr:hypothetical protein [Pediococcus ethanolidurans]MCT4397324.1 hypothetical protein [Pediococcus ethanolidurans]